MPQDDPIQVLITQGYPPDVAKQMVESGAYNTLTQPILPNLTGGIGGTPSNLGGNVSNVNTVSTPSEVSPELQTLLDQGYNMEEAQQLMSSENYNPQAVDQQNKEANRNQIGEALEFGAGLGGGVSLEQAAHGLGAAIGSEKGAAKTLGIIGGAGKLVMGTARGIASGLGSAKRDQYVQEYYDKKKQEGRAAYTAAPQAGNVNYLGGDSYAEDGGIQGETLPLKNYLKGKGFTKPGYKKLM